MHAHARAHAGAIGIVRRRRVRDARARGNRGFTLIELLIAVAIVGILAAIALPSYSAYLQKTRRTDATVLLMEAAGEQVRHFSENNRYAGAMTALGYAADAAVTDEGHYTVSTSSSGAARSDFTLTATPVSGGVQAGDTACATLTITSTGAKGPVGCW